MDDWRGPGRRSPPCCFNGASRPTRPGQREGPQTWISSPGWMIFPGNFSFPPLQARVWGKVAPSPWKARATFQKESPSRTRTVAITRHCPGLTSWFSYQRGGSPSWHEIVSIMLTKNAICFIPSPPWFWD